jgi:hypothetical protein
MSKIIFAIVAVLVSSAASAISEQQLWGTWKLVSATKRDVNSGETADAYGGQHPNGFISYAKDHRMMAMAAYDNRFKPARVDQTTAEQRDQLYRSFWGYAGTYELKGNSIEHHIETSWNETWTGVTVTRDVAYDGKKLILTTGPQLNLEGKTIVITLTWEKVK